MKITEDLKYWQAHQIAECLPYENFLDKESGDDLYVKLWNIQNNSENQTPMGGDGSNGTMETPDDLMNLEYTDKAIHFWDQLTEEEKIAILKAYDFEFSNSGAENLHYLGY